MAQTFRKLHFPTERAARDTGSPLIRAAAANLLGHVNKRPIHEVLRRHWPNDRDVELVLRAESSPATVNSNGWADSLAATAVADFIVSMGPASAGAVLLSHGLQLRFGNAAILCPGLLSSATNASFVEEVRPFR